MNAKHLIFAAAILLAASPAYAQGPPVWGQQPAWRSPGLNDQACGPQGCSPYSSPTQQQPSINAKAFYDSIGGDQLAKAVVRVSVQDRNGHTSLGSGTLVEAYDDGSGLVVTNNHVVAEAASATSGSVFYRGGRQSQFTIRDADPTWDIAILEVEAPAEVEPVKIGSDPSRGEALMIGGYGGNNRLEFQAGVFTVGLTPQRGGPEGWFRIQPARARRGDSGGPVFNARGEFVGALWGSGNPQDPRDTDPNHTACIKGSRIIGLLQAVRERLGRILRGGGNLGGLQPLPQRPAPVLPGPITGQPRNPNQSPTSPPAESGPPSNDSNSSGQPAGGELATILDRIKELEGKLADRAGPAIVDEGKQLAEAAAPSLIAGLIDKLAPLALTALGSLTGIGLPIGGVAAGSWLAAKLARFVVRKIAVKTAAKKQGFANGTEPSGAGTPQLFPQSFDPQVLVASEVSRIGAALKHDLQTQIDAKLSIIGQQAKATAEIVASKPDPAPQFVPTQVDNPQLIALEKALETFGGQTPANAKWVNLIYSFRDQLLNRAKSA